MKDVAFALNDLQLNWESFDGEQLLVVCIMRTGTMALRMRLICGNQEGLRPVIDKSTQRAGLSADSCICTVFKFEAEKYTSLMNGPSIARTPQQDRARITREAILNAATQILGAEGAKAVTHRRVADLASVSLASTTYHFKNKAELLSAAFDWLIEIYITSVRARLRVSMGDNYTKKDLADLLIRVSRHTFRKKDDRHLICAWYEFMLEAARNPALQDTANKWYSDTCDYYEEVLEKCRSRNPREDARRLVDCMIGYEMSALAAGRENYGAKSLRQTYTHLVESMFDDED